MVTCFVFNKHASVDSPDIRLTCIILHKCRSQLDFREIKDFAKPSWKVSMNTIVLELLRAMRSIRWMKTQQSQCLGSQFLGVQDDD